MKILYNYLFHYNYFTGFWAAIPRGLEADYFNGKETKGIRKGRKIESLIRILEDLDGKK